MAGGVIFVLPFNQLTDKIENKPEIPIWTSGLIDAHISYQ